jgi:hypothetical protein
MSSHDQRACAQHDVPVNNTPNREEDTRGSSGDDTGGRLERAASILARGAIRAALRAKAPAEIVGAT